MWSAFSRQSSTARPSSTSSTFLEVGPVQQPQSGAAGGQGEARQQGGDVPASARRGGEGRLEGLDRVSSGADLWAGHADFFPNLQFLDRVQEDLENLDPRWFKGARRLLRQLQASAAGWDPVTSPTGPHWQAPNIRPEHENARRNRFWDDQDGVSRCFELHGNLNRGAGRIYFRLVHDEKAIRVAHLGRHL